MFVRQLVINPLTPISQPHMFEYFLTFDNFKHTPPISFIQSKSKIVFEEHIKHLLVSTTRCNVVKEHGSRGMVSQRNLE